MGHERHLLLNLQLLENGEGHIEQSNSGYQVILLLIVFFLYLY